MFKKDLFSGGISSISISIFSILKSVFLIRVFGLSNSLDAYYLGISIFQVLSINVIRYFLLSMQPNIIGRNNIFRANYFLLSFSLTIFINLFIYFASELVLGLFTENINIKNEIFDNFNLFFILSFVNTFFVIFNTYLNTIISIRLSLLFDFIISFLLFVSILVSGGDIYLFLLLNISSFLFLILIEIIIIYRRAPFRVVFIRDNEWFTQIFKNFKNYMISFSVNIISSIFEKNILTNSYSTGDLSVYNTASKGISPFTSLLSNQSVLLVSYAKKPILESKKLLRYHLSNISVISIFIIVLVHFAIEFSKPVIINIFDVSGPNADQIIDTFKFLSISVFSSVLFSSISKFLSAFNYTNYILKLNLIIGIQFIILLYLFKNTGLTGVIYAICINSYLAVLYSIFFLKKVIKINVFNLLRTYKINIFTVVLFSVLPLMYLSNQSIYLINFIRLTTLFLTLKILMKSLNSSYE